MAIITKTLPEQWFGGSISDLNWADIRPYRISSWVLKNIKDGKKVSMFMGST